MHRREEESPVTEDDVNEVKMEISSMRYEILEIFEKNGMDIAGAEKKEKTVLAKKMKVWERRLMKDFQVAGMPEECIEEEDENEEPANLTGLARFKKAAQKVATNTASSKWGQVMTDVGVVTNSQIGRCRNRQSFKNQQNLQRAMEEARRLVTRSPISRSGSASPIDPKTGDDPGDTLMQMLKNMAAEMQEISPGHTLKVEKKKGHSRSTTPVNSQLLQDIMTGKTPIPKSPVCDVRKSPLPKPVSKETLCKTSATTVDQVKSPDRRRSVGVTSPPPIIEITEPAVVEESPENIPEPPPLPVKTPSTPKKRKAPSPESAAVSRPIHSKPPSNQGMIPPPPSRKDKPERASSPQPQITVVKPPPADSIITIPRCESPLPTVVSISTKGDNMTITMESGAHSGSSSSLEKLVPFPGVETPSPVRLRPVRRVEDVTTTKRQPKTGWL